MSWISRYSIHIFVAEQSGQKVLQCETSDSGEWRLLTDDTLRRERPDEGVVLHTGMPAHPPLVDLEVKVAEVHEVGISEDGTGRILMW